MVTGSVTVVQLGSPGMVRVVQPRDGTEGTAGSAGSLAGGASVRVRENELGPLGAGAGSMLVLAEAGGGRAETVGVLRDEDIGITEVLVGVDGAVLGTDERPGMLAEAGGDGRDAVEGELADGGGGLVAQVGSAALVVEDEEAGDGTGTELRGAERLEVVGRGSTDDVGARGVGVGRPSSGGVEVLGSDRDVVPVRGGGGSTAGEVLLTGTGAGEVEVAGKDGGGAVAVEGGAGTNELVMLGEIVSSVEALLADVVVDGSGGGDQGVIGGGVQDVTLDGSITAGGVLLADVVDDSGGGDHGVMLGGSQTTEELLVDGPGGGDGMTLDGWATTEELLVDTDDTGGGSEGVTLGGWTTADEVLLLGNVVDGSGGGDHGVTLGGSQTTEELLADVIDGTGSDDGVTLGGSTTREELLLIDVVDGPGGGDHGVILGGRAPLEELLAVGATLGGSTTGEELLLIDVVDGPGGGDHGVILGGKATLEELLADVIDDPGSDDGETLGGSATTVELLADVGGCDGGVGASVELVGGAEEPSGALVGGSEGLAVAGSDALAETGGETGAVGGSTVVLEGATEVSGSDGAEVAGGATGLDGASVLVGTGGPTGEEGAVGSSDVALGGAADVAGSDDTGLVGGTAVLDVAGGSTGGVGRQIVVRGIPRVGCSTGVPVRTGGETTVPVRTGGETTVPVRTGGLSTGVPVRTGGLFTVVPESTGGLSTVVPVSTGGFSTVVPVRTGGFSTVVPVSTGGFSTVVPVRTGGLVTGVPVRIGGETGVPVRTGGSTGVPVRIGGVTGVPVSTLVARVVGTDDGGSDVGRPGTSQRRQTHSRRSETVALGRMRPRPSSTTPPYDAKPSGVPRRIMTRRLTLRMPGPPVGESPSMQADHGPAPSKARSTVTALDATSGPGLVKEMFLVTVCAPCQLPARRGAPWGRDRFMGQGSRWRRSATSTPFPRP